MYFYYVTILLLYNLSNVIEFNLTPYIVGPSLSANDY